MLYILTSGKNTFDRRKVSYISDTSQNSSSSLRLPRTVSTMVWIYLLSPENHVLKACFQSVIPGSSEMRLYWSPFGYSSDRDNGPCFVSSSSPHCSLCCEEVGTGTCSHYCHLAPSSET